MRTIAVSALCGFLAIGCRPSSIAQVPADLVNGLAWRPIGPAVMGGRINDVAVVETDTATAYVATATAGLWKTTNHGTTFAPVFDEQPCQTIGAVAVAASDPSVVWAGTGEANNRQSSSWGCGVFRSVDAGVTWRHVGLSDTLHIARIAVDRRNADVAYVAAVGHLWGANEERGLYKTEDGGKTWKAVLQVNADTGCTDVVLDPSNQDTVYAAMYQRRRAAWGFIGGGPGSGLYRSNDAGKTWARLGKGLPQGDKGRIGIDVCRKDPRVVYAVVEARDGGVFRSEDHGDTWTKMSSTNPRPMYFSNIRVDPNDDQFVWLAGVSFARSKDGGRNFTAESGARLHADIHAIWIDPRDSRHMLVGCDGGLQWTFDRGQTWDHCNIIPLAQFYGIAFDMERPYNVAGGLQDNGSWHGPSSKGAGSGPSNGDWRNIGGGDGFVCAIDRDDANTVYSESQNGAVRRVHLATGLSKSITPVPPSGEQSYRWDWCTPFMLSPHNPRKVLLGGNRLFISTDRGDTWRRTEDLTTSPSLSDKVLMGVKRGRAYPFPDIGSDFGQIVTVTESPVKEGVVYVGTDDGNLQVSRDDGRTWKNVVGHVPGVPSGTYVSRVHASPHAAGRVYAAFDGHRSDDYRAYAYVSEDFGESWRLLSAGIPDGSTVNVVRDHPGCESLLFAGTDRGLFVSTDRGAHWTRFGKPLPPLRVDEVLVHPRENDLIVATHARGAYILDDIGALVAEASPKISRMMLLSPRPAVMYRGAFGMSSLTGNRQFLTRGAPSGAQIRYWLAAEPKLDERLMLSIETKRGKVLSSRRIITANAGHNSTSWDFRVDPSAGSRPAPAAATTPPQPGARQTGRGARPGQTRTAGQTRRAGGGMSRGLRVLPGEYIVRLKLGDLEQTAHLQVTDDPRITLSTGDKRRLYELCERLSTRSAALRQAERQAQALEEALTRGRDGEAMKSAPKEAAEALNALLSRTKVVRARLAGRDPSGAEPPQPASQQTLGPAGQVVSFTPRSAVSAASVLARYAMALDSVPEMPSRALEAEIRAAEQDGRTVLKQVSDLLGPGLRKLNGILKRAKLPVVEPIETESDDLGPIGFSGDDEVGQ